MSFIRNLVAANTENTVSNFSAPNAEPREKVQVHHVRLVQITEQDVWPCLVFSNYPKMLYSLGSVLLEEEWSKVQRRLSVEFQMHLMSSYRNMTTAADMPVVFLLGATTACKTASVYGIPGSSAIVGTGEFNTLMGDLGARGVFHNEEFCKALEQMQQISHMTAQWSQEATQELPAAPAATENSAMTEASKPLEATLVMDEDESLVGVGKGNRKKPKQAPTEPKDAEFETPGAAAAAKGQGGEASIAGQPPENPTPMQEDETEYPMEEIDQVEQQNDDEEKTGESNDAASAAASAMDLDSQSVKSTGRKQKSGTKRKDNTTAKPSTDSKRARSNSPPHLYEDEGIELRIPTFTKVKPLLKKAGYTFRKGIYCRPKGDPKKYPNAVEGNDYFATESAFREFLCRKGVDCNGKEFKENDKENTITPWIRYNVITSRKDETILPTLKITPKNALILLKNKLNFRYISELQSGYMLPGVAKKEAKHGVNTFPEMPNLWVYLARHGLPDNCPFEKITPSDRLALEQFIAKFDSDHLDL
jgi:hypothetical protein